MKGQQRLLYLLPACILVFAFFLFPLAYLSYISFFEWDGLGPRHSWDLRILNMCFRIRFSGQQ